MSKRHRPKSSGQTTTQRTWLLAVVVIASLLVVGAVWWRQRPPHTIASTKAPAPRETNTVAQSVMVTVELDFGATPPRLEEALQEIERRSEPADGTGRTFAVLDADGSVATNGSWRLQMHVSMEKPGAGALVFRRNGQVLWQSMILPAPTGPPPPKRLTILMANGAGQSLMLDGSKGAARVLDVPLNNSSQRVRDAWPDGAEREFTFLYSVCGCPVKARVRRTGETTARTGERPVMFPDDPEAMQAIRALMGWNQVR